MGDLARILAELIEGYAAGGGLLLLTDYDGTLTPLAGDPDAPWLTHDVRVSLRALARSPRIRVAVISGRDLADIRARVGVPEAIYAGCHGLEIDGPDISFTHPGAVSQQGVLRAVSRALSERASSIDGMRVEPKRLGVAVHYRQVAPEAFRQVEIELARAIQPQADQLTTLPGTRVIEVLPRVGWHKGKCALWIRDWARRRLPPPVTVLYMGDDWTDEHAFEALAGQAITLRVGVEPRASRAAYRLKEVTRIHLLLSVLAAEIGGRSGT